MKSDKDQNRVQTLILNLQEARKSGLLAQPQGSLVGVYDLSGARMINGFAAPLGRETGVFIELSQLCDVTDFEKNQVYRQVSAVERKFKAAKALPSLAFDPVMKEQKVFDGLAYVQPCISVTLIRESAESGSVYDFWLDLAYWFPPALEAQARFWAENRLTNKHRKPLVNCSQLPIRAV